MHSYNIKIIVSILCLMLWALAAAARPTSPIAVATAHPLATKAGLDILKQGGNAYDAAAAISAVLAVVEPYSSGLGGGGFWLLHRADGRQVMIDGRETAPIKATSRMYLDPKDEVIPRLSKDGALAAGIPGVPAGIVHLVRYYGKLELSTVLQPAIDIANQGFEVSAHYQKLARYRLEVMKQYPHAADIFLHDGKVPELGHIVIQKDLADTLSLIAEYGHAGFYNGDFARKLVAGVQQAGGIWELADLETYQVKERPPTIIRYRDMTITTVTLPSAGGVVLAQSLNMLSHFDLSKLNKADQIHLVVEVLRRAYYHRSVYLGDSDFVAVPMAKLLDADYIEGLALTIDMEQATRSSELGETPIKAYESQHTTHFSVIDSAGNRVAATLSINLPFGSGFVAKGTGVLLNDEMDDFSVKPHTPNAYGLVSGGHNSIVAGKRPMSSMSPTFIEDDERIAILGTPGGSRIISMVLLGILDFAAGNPPSSWVSNPRYHHQYLPDVIQLEPQALAPSLFWELQQKGHQLQEINRRYGNMQAIMYWKKRNIIFAASDPRGEGSAEVFYLSP